MGSYTPTQRYYLPLPSELEDVDTDLNYNLKRADERLAPLIRYQPTNEPSISASELPKDVGFKWYKTYSNSLWVYSNISGVTEPRQDTDSQVDNWSTSGIAFEPTYAPLDTGLNQVAYSVSNGFVRWRGRVHLGTNAELPANTAVDILTPPTAVLPNRARYFFINGGLSAANFQLMRIMIPAATDVDKRIEFFKYGGVSLSTDNRYVSLFNVYYPLTDGLP